MGQFVGVLMKSAEAGKPDPRMGGAPGVTVDERTRYNEYVEEEQTGGRQHKPFEQWRKEQRNAN